MIVTLTANPAIDRTIEIDGPLERGAVQRASGTRQQAGGKGVNVARALAASNVEAVAVFPAAADDPFTAAMRAEGLAHRATPIRGAVRVNLAVTEPDGTTTKVNEPGPELSTAELEALVDEVVAASRGASWLVLAGSLPGSTPATLYARVIEAVRSRLGAGAPRIAIDSSGAPLLETLRAGVPVDLIKPNAHELAELVAALDAGSPLDGDALEADPAAAMAAAERALALGVGAVLLTLGGAGAAYLDERTTLVATHPPVAVASTVGAGDASLAGFLLAHGEGAAPDAALAQAVAHGAAAAQLPGSTLPARADTTPEAVCVRAWPGTTPPDQSTPTTERSVP